MTRAQSTAGPLESADKRAAGRRGESSETSGSPSFGSNMSNSTRSEVMEKKPFKC